MIAALYGVGVGYVHELDPAHPGLGGGLFFAAQSVGMAAGGPLIAWAQSRFGLPAAFLLPASAITVGALLVLFTRPQPAAPQAAGAMPPRSEPRVPLAHSGTGGGG